MIEGFLDGDDYDHARRLAAYLEAEKAGRRDADDDVLDRIGRAGGHPAIADLAGWFQATDVSAIVRIHKSYLVRFTMVSRLLV